MALCSCPVVAAEAAEVVAEHQWPGWRGPLHAGVAPAARPPVHFSESHHLRWKTAIPGRGVSSPVIWGKRIFVTSAVPSGVAVQQEHTEAEGAHDNVPPSQRLRYTVFAVDRHDGAILWSKVVREGVPHAATHATGSWASASPVTDGQMVYASFGSAGLYALDMTGQLIWSRDMGSMNIRHEHGEGSSPALYGESLVVNWDHQGQSFVAALDKNTGKSRWKVLRDEITSWSSPLVVEVQGKPQVVVSATGRVRSYDLAAGDPVWNVGGLSRNVVATPVAGGGLVYVANSYDWQAMLAIRLSGARGDLTDSGSVVWTRSRDTPYVSSPLLYEGDLCFIKHLQGVFTCVDAASGATRFGPVRLPGMRSVFASPVAAAGRIYIAGRSGRVLVLEHGSSLKVLAANQLDDSFTASPALVDDALYLRGDHNLYGLGAPAAPESGPPGAQEKGDLMPPG